MVFTKQARQKKVKRNAIYKNNTQPTMSISKKLLEKPLETKWCRECGQYQEHVGGTLCVGCSLDEEDINWYIRNVESQKEREKQSESKPTPPKPLTHAKEGDELVLSDGSTAEVTGVTSRSVKASGRSFVKSDGTGWGSNELDAALL